MRIVLVSLFDIHNFAVRILHRVLLNNGYDVVSVFYKTNYSDTKSTDEEICQLSDRINSFNADVVGFTLRSAFYPEFKRIAPLINSRIIVGGQHPTVCPEDFEGYTVCIGDGEDVICDIIEGKDGVVYGGMAKDIDTVPMPSTSPMEKMSVMTTRGCFFDCSFCYNSLQREIIKGWKVRRRSIDSVMAEISQLNNAKEIVISDNVFTWGYDWLADFCQEFKKTGKKFRCFGHFGLIDGDILAMLKDAGCHMITMGIQGNERMRKKYFNKHETDWQMIEGSKVIAESGLLGRYDVLRDIPYETDADRMELDSLIGSLKKPFITREFPLLYHPKTQFTKRCLNDGLISESDIQGVATNAYKKWGKFTRHDN